MNTRILPAFVIAGMISAGVFVGTAKPEQAHVQSASPKPSIVSSKTAVPPLKTSVSPWASLKANLDLAVQRGDVARANSLIETNLERPFRPQLREYQANLLARTGQEAAALDVFVGLLGGHYGRWEPNSRKLTVALNLAVQLNRQLDADQIASWIVSHPEWEYSSFDSLAIPKSGKTANLRLAYAYLTLAHNADWSEDKEARVRYLEKANRLAPTDVPVTFQLATAYRSRKKAGDLSLAENLLKRSYNALPEASAAKRAIRIQAAMDGIDVAGPKAKTSLQDDFRIDAAERKEKVLEREQGLGVTRNQKG
jgi:tetratricopeptide (TPR) repeat protein